MDHGLLRRLEAELPRCVYTLAGVLVQSRNQNLLLGRLRLRLKVTLQLCHMLAPWSCDFLIATNVSKTRVT